MAENDIYDSKGTYGKFLQKLDMIHIPPKSDHRSLYYCKNKENVQYFRKLAEIFEAKDLSYRKRLRQLQFLKTIVHVTEKDLAKLTREDIDKIMAFSHERFNTIESKKDFAKALKYIWRRLFPEKDAHGRYDDTVVPWVVRHVPTKIDKAKEKRREDYISIAEFEAMINNADDSRMKFFISLAFESLARPQEMLYTRLRDIEDFGEYAKIHVSGHGKEGIKFLKCIDSYQYLIEWLRLHPNKKPDSFIFVNIGNPGKGGQMSSKNLNKQISKITKKCGIQKQITAYSLKRSAISIRVLLGENDASIQRTAGWSSTRQLQTYDLNDAERFFKKELVERGLMKDEEGQFKSKTKKCSVCNTINGLGETHCKNCKRLLDTKKLFEESEKKDERIKELENKVGGMDKLMEDKFKEMYRKFSQENMFSQPRQMPWRNDQQAMVSVSGVQVHDREFIAFGKKKKETELYGNS